MNHSHGPHECHCTDSGYTVVVDAGIPCTSLRCPGDSMPMRASQTGEYRGAYRYPTTGVAQGGDNGSWVLKFVLGIGGGLALLALAATMLSGVKEEKEE